VSTELVTSETIRFPVHGMTCSSCVARITRHVRRLDGVASVRVDLGAETATVRRDAARVSDAALVRAIAEAGYEADLGAAVAVTQAATSRGLLDRLLRR
jgi:Cu+-exporting ATPase